MRSLVTILKAVLFLVSVVACALFAWQNSKPAQLSFFGWSSNEYPLFSFMFLAFAAGVFCTGIFTVFEMWGMRSALRRSKRMREMLEREVDALRNQPLYDEPPPPRNLSEGPLSQPMAHEGLPEDSIDIPKREERR